MAQIAILSAGEMGAGIGGALARAGHTVTTIVAGRGAETRERAAEAGMQPIADMAALVNGAEFVLSIVPPAVAEATGLALAEAMRATGARPVFVECNAIAPQTSGRIAAGFEAIGVTAVDGGLIGGPPPRDHTRLYVSGPGAGQVAALKVDEFAIVDLAAPYGHASALKMTYASVTKGLNTLITAAFVTAARSGILDALLAEFGDSQPALLKRAEVSIPRLPADAGRWVREMHEIAATYEAAGLTPGFHEGAASVMEMLAASAFGYETRRTIDRSRTMAGTIRALAEG